MKLLSEKVLSAILTMLAATVLLSGCGTTSEPIFTSDPVLETSPGTNSNGQGYSTNEAGVRFQIGDLINITFAGTPQPLEPHQERVKEDGTITLDLIGSVKAVGRSPGDLQKEIHDRYVPKYYVRLTVTVGGQSQELAYSVLGEVRSPGPKPYLGVTTVTKAIGAAGGLTDFASKNVTLIRANGTKVKVSYKKAIQDPKSDPQIFPGDSIFVDKSIW